MLPLMLTLVPTLERATHPAWNERLRSTSHVYFHPSLFHTTHAILNEFFSSPRIMDATLRCNKPNGGCRTPLVDKAVVTTCCHIFCLRCADGLGLTRAAAEARSCPACNQHLPNTDDAVTTVLHPTEDYKTSVLSGLDPTTIMECAGRALAFWSYQTAQEMQDTPSCSMAPPDQFQRISRVPRQDND